MPRCYTTLTLDDAKRMLQAGEAAAASIGIAYNIAVVDAGGNLLWTRDVELARKVARNLYTSGVFINAVTASDLAFPWAVSKTAATVASFHTSVRTPL